MKRVNQYEIVIVNLDPTIGREIKKTRPCIIVSPNEINRNLNIVTIVPITSQSKSYPTRVEIELSGNKNWAVIEQIRTIDKRRIHKIIGKLRNTEIKRIKEKIKETYVD